MLNSPVVSHTASESVPQHRRTSFPDSLQADMAVIRNLCDEISRRQIEHQNRFADDCSALSKAVRALGDIWLASRNGEELPSNGGVQQKPEYEELKSQLEAVKFDLHVADETIRVMNSTRSIREEMATQSALTNARPESIPLSTAQPANVRMV